VGSGASEPVWQPIGRLGLIGSLIDEGLAGAREQYSLLLGAKHGPRVLDDKTVERTCQVFGEAREDVDLYDRQLRRWGGQALTPRQRREVDRLTLQLASLREVVDDILGLADELGGSTIEAIVAKSDLEVGLEALFGGQILHPPRPRASTASRGPSAGPEAGLALPPGVSLASIPEPGVLGWVIRHSHLGDVGCVVLSDVARGHCRMEAQVVGPAGDPAFDLRRHVVEGVQPR
jgi:hypothetical protein